MWFMCWPGRAHLGLQRELTGFGAIRFGLMCSKRSSQGLNPPEETEAITQKGLSFEVELGPDWVGHALWKGLAIRVQGWPPTRPATGLLCPSARGRTCPLSSSLRRASPAREDTGSSWGCCRVVGDNGRDSLPQQALRLLDSRPDWHLGKDARLHFGELAVTFPHLLTVPLHGGLRERPALPDGPAPLCPPRRRGHLRPPST